MATYSIKGSHPNAQTYASSMGTFASLAKAKKALSTLGKTSGYPRSQFKVVKGASNPTQVPIGKFIPARFNRDGTVSVVVTPADRSKARATKNPLRVKNVEYGHTIGTGMARRFFPHRGSADYDPTYLSGSEGVRARAAKKKKVAPKKKAATKRKATKKRATKRKR